LAQYWSFYLRGFQRHPLILFKKKKRAKLLPRGALCVLPKSVSLLLLTIYIKKKKKKRAKLLPPKKSFNSRAK